MYAEGNCHTEERNPEQRLDRAVQRLSFLLNSQTGVFRHFHPSNMKSCKHLYDFVKRRRMNPNDVMDIWLKGDATNLPSQILFLGYLGIKLRCSCLCCYRHTATVVKNHWEKEDASSLDVLKMLYFITEWLNILIHILDLTIWIELLNICVHLWVWIYRRSGRITAWDVRDSRTQESERKLPEIKNLFTWIIFYKTTYAVKSSSNQYITWLHFKWWLFFSHTLLSLIKGN